jgi:hypothetical protein
LSDACKVQGTPHPTKTLDNCVIPAARRRSKTISTFTGVPPWRARSLFPSPVPGTLTPGTSTTGMGVMAKKHKQKGFFFAEDLMGGPRSDPPFASKLKKKPAKKKPVKKRSKAPGFFPEEQLKGDAPPPLDFGEDYTSRKMVREWLKRHEKDPPKPSKSSRPPKGQKGLMDRAREIEAEEKKKKKPPTE